MRKQLEEILVRAKAEIAAATNENELKSVQVAYLGKKGALTSILRGMGALSAEERPVIGALANDVRTQIDDDFTAKLSALRAAALEHKLQNERLDVTLPAKAKKHGRLHPLTQVQNDLSDIFVAMGFSVAEGPEVELAYNNFDALNAPVDHPSRDFQDTFYITPEVLLRTQTSPVQIRVMKDSQPPIRVISPGRVYRCDEVDGTHSPMFHQLEGLVVDKNVGLADLKGTLELFAKIYFGEETKTRFRPHNFPFTEPSAEVDVSCFVCGGKGCRLCKGEGWIEILGAGMVHPNVLKNCGIDPEVYSGFAFGMGLERIVMIKYGIEDMRYLYENDLRFLKQF